MDNDQEEQQKKQNPIDTTNDFINRTQNKYRNIKRERRVFKLIFRYLRTIITKESWATPVAGIVGLIIFIIILTVILTVGTGYPNTSALSCGGVCVTTCSSTETQDTSGTCNPDSSGTPQVCCIPQTTCEAISGNCRVSCYDYETPNTTAKCDLGGTVCCVPASSSSCDSDPAKYMKDTFNVVVETSVKSQLTTICNILSIPGKSALYTSLLKRGGPTNISFDSAPCGGRTLASGDIILHSFWSCGSAQNFVLIHETGHTIAIYNGGVSRSFTPNAYYPNDSSCYYYNGACDTTTKYFLKTYTGGCGGGGKPESFAESLSLYVIPRGALSNYKSQCPTGYNWEKNNIFGGYEF